MSDLNDGSLVCDTVPTATKVDSSMFFTTSRQVVQTDLGKASVQTVVDVEMY